MPRSRVLSQEFKAPVALGDATRSAAHFVRRHRLFLTIFTLLGVILAFAVLSFVTPQYKARAVLTIDGRGARLLNAPTVMPEFTLELPLVETYGQMLYSPELARRVIDKLDLRNNEELNPDLRSPVPGNATGARAAIFRTAEYVRNLMGAIADDMSAFLRQIGLEAEGHEPKSEFSGQAQTGETYDDPVIQEFLRRLRINAIDKSYAFSVEYYSGNPYVAAAVTNTLARLFISSEVDQKRQTTVEASQSLNGWLSELQTKVIRAEQAASEFRDAAGLTKAKEVTLPEQRLSEANAQLVTARADRLQAEARLQQLKRSTGDASQASPDVLNSPLIRALREQESTVMRRAADLSNVYGPKHPAVRNVQAELGDLRKKIREETDRIAAGLETEAATAKSREEFLVNNLHELQTQTTKLNASAVRLNELEREAEALRSVYKQMMPRVTEIQLQGQHETPSVRLAAAAVVPQSPFFPKRIPALAAAGLAFFLAALAIALVRERILRGFSYTDEVQEATGLPVIALLPTVSRRRLAYSDAVAVGSADPMFREALRSVQTALLLTPQSESKTVLVTSSVSGEGKSFLSAALALQMSRAGRRCLLIDCDLRLPTAHRILGLNDRVGLLQYLAGQISRDELVQIHPSGLHFIASGASAFRGPTEDQADLLPDLLASFSFKGLLRSLPLQYDAVIIDSPPALAISDVEILASLVDRIIYAVRWRDTGKETVTAALQRIASTSTASAAIVLTQVDTRWYASSASSDADLYSRKYHHYLTGRAS
jgi:succinoglycan biosynthesis transport protein ExoP